MAELPTTPERGRPAAPAAPRPLPSAAWPTWLAVALPLAALALLLVALAALNPARVFVSDAPPLEALTLERIAVLPEGFRVTVVNGGAAETTIAQVMVDDAYWSFTADPGPSLGRLGRATLTIPYPWVRGEPHVVRVVTNLGTTFEADVPAATLTPTPGLREFGAYGLLGFYVGVLPVALGMLWLPAMRRLGRRGMGAVLALTLGLLIFLLVDTLLEAFEIAAELPGVFQGLPLALFAALLTWLALLALGQRRGGPAGASPAQQRLWVAGLIALSIGLHNFGEGLAIGAAFALGEAALGSFLVIGFTLHNVTEGIGIAAPVTRDAPSVRVLAGLALLAGLPAIVGAWVGGFAFSPLWATLFLGIGVGAIWQVIVEVGRLLQRDAEKDGLPVVNWLNVGALLAGIGIMYLTAFLVK